MKAWPWEIVETLAIFGGMMAGFFAILAIYGLFLWLKDQIIFLYRRHKDKTFAKKAPKPCCWCIQCGSWHTSEPERDRGFCCIWDKWTASNEGCTMGYLRTKEEYKKEEQRIKE